jgi:phage baseplate assembly protein V
MINHFEQIIQRITALESQMAQLVRVGLVTLVLPEKGKVRVRILDDECLETYELAVLYPKTRLDKYYRMPDIGEQVLCIFLPRPGGMQVGFVMGAMYSELDPVPVADAHKTRVHFEDGSWMQYDKSEGTLQVHARGGITLAAPVIKLLTSSLLGPLPTPTDGEVEILPIEAPEPEECDG